MKMTFLPIFDSIGCYCSLKFSFHWFMSEVKPSFHSFIGDYDFSFSELPINIFAFLYKTFFSKTILCHILTQNLLISITHIAPYYSLSLKTFPSFDFQNIYILYIYIYIYVCVYIYSPDLNSPMTIYMVPYLIIHLFPSVSVHSSFSVFTLTLSVISSFLWF